MIDIPQEIGAISRKVAQQASASGATVVVTVSRRLTARIEDVWAALTDPERVRRWFLPLTGDLRAGGTYQLEGNASGEIVTCEPPNHLAITFGGASSLVDLHLSAEGEQTLLEFDHTVPVEMAGSTAGALYVGPGWDGALLALGRYLDPRLTEDPLVGADSPESQTFSAESIEAWSTIISASGTTDADAIATARKAALAQFAPDLGHHGAGRR
jgi:uncharacterized protein YndB with AHSA1/START domain